MTAVGTRATDYSKVAIRPNIVTPSCFSDTNHNWQVAVLELARSGADLKGYVAFHGGLSTPEGLDYSLTKE